MCLIKGEENGRIREGMCLIKGGEKESVKDRENVSDNEKRERTC